MAAHPSPPTPLPQGGEGTCGGELVVLRHGSTRPCCSECAKTAALLSFLLYSLPSPLAGRESKVRGLRKAESGGPNRSRSRRMLAGTSTENQPIGGSRVGEDRFYSSCKRQVTRAGRWCSYDSKIFSPPAIFGQAPKPSAKPPQHTRPNAATRKGFLPWSRILDSLETACCDGGVVL